MINKNSNPNRTKRLIFDTSSIISLVTNDLSWTLKPLKEKFNGEFVIPQSVKKELVDYPLKTNRFKFEALRVQSFIEKGILTMKERLDISDLLRKVNHIYYAGGENIKILHYGEMEALAMAIAMKADAYVVDERTMRWLIEDPVALKQLLEAKLHTPVRMDMDAARNFTSFVKGLNVIRSTELMMVAFELGLLQSFITKEYGSKELVDAVLWALRLNGCAISTEEINELVRMETK